MISVLGIAEGKLHRLEQKRAQQAAYENDNIWYTFLVAPSCPPDKRLHIRGGIATPSARWGAIMAQSQIPDWVCDFEDEDATDMSLSFSNANYYLPLILCYFGDWVAYRTVSPPTYDDPQFDNVVGTEVETAGEAESQIDALLNGSDDWYYYRFPLWGVVLRNDGNVGINYAILPIDAVNRGRSYLYRDARARNSLIE